MLPSRLYNNKVVSSESGEKHAQIKHHLQVKTVQNSSKQICWWEDNRGWTFSVEKTLDYELYFGQKQQFKVKTP